MGLLGDIFSAGNTAKRRLRGLLDDPIGSMQQAVDNAFPTRYEAQNAISQLRGQQYNPDALQAYNTKLDSAAMNFAPMGITVWHGSPHKFSKFDMSKIGTGEGAQAYGHGLYFAESPEVAKSYLNSADIPPRWEYKGRKPEYIETLAKDTFMYGGKTPEERLNFIESTWPNGLPNGMSKEQLKSLVIDGLKDWNHVNPQSLYKVDIPDEAVARFLDWDKKLSEQALEVQAFVNSEAGLKLFNKGRTLAGLRPWDKIPDWMTGEQLAASAGLKEGSSSALSGLGSQTLAKNGIPGIRYLDGGSRGTGTGTSNFVLFSDDLPRILEINGQPTGQVPWAPNEWRGLLGGQ